MNPILSNHFFNRYARGLTAISAKSFEITGKAFLPVTIVLCLSVFKSNAQNKISVTDTFVHISEYEKEFKHDLNFVKLDLAALAQKSYSIQYEKVLNRKTSIALTYKVMPGTTMPLKNLVVNTAGQDDKNMAKTIENLRISHSAFTPELRFYLGKKGYGRGFYIAPFYRYAGFKTNELRIHYGDSTHQETSIKLAGKLITHTAGLMLGAQWIVRKRICLDWWILGPHYGKGKGDLSGVSSKALTSEQQKNVTTELNNLDIPLTRKTVNVNDKGASLQLNGLWAGIRGGVSIGLKY